MITLYGMSSSGNCYKLQLLMAQLGRACEWEEIDVTRGENLSPEFLAMNDRGKVPVLKLDDGRTMSESNAILNFLAQGTPLLPDDAWERAKTLQWMFFEQYSHEPYIAVSRFVRKFLPADHPRRASLDALKASGDEALAAMERHLTRLPWFGGERYTIADIATFPWVRNLVGFYDAGELVVFADFPNVARVLQAFVQRPAVQRGLEIPKRD